MFSSTAHPNSQTRSETFRTVEIKIKSVVRSKKMLMAFELWDLPPTTDCLAPELIFFSSYFQGLYSSSFLIAPGMKQEKEEEIRSRNDLTWLIQ